jgi:hypothetical protein
MSSRLSMHVGLEKTGSTSLQAELSLKCSNFLSRDTALESSQRLSLWRIRQAFLRMPPTWWHTQDGRELLGAFNRSCDEKMAKNFVFSFENLLAHDLYFSENAWSRSSMGQVWTSVDHLGVLLRSSVLREMSWNLLVTVRRQPEWLASLYVQRSNRIRNAGQFDFEAKVKNILKSEAHTMPPFNIHSMFGEIEQKLNPDSLSVVALEAIGEDRSTKVLSDWLGVDCTIEPLTLDSEHNSRHVERNHSWELRRFGDSERIDFGSRLAKAIRDRWSPAKPERIVLSADLKSQILSRARTSNRLASAYAEGGLPDYF